MDVFDKMVGRLARRRTDADPTPSEPVAVTDRDGLVTSWRSAAQELLG